MVTGEICERFGFWKFELPGFHNGLQFNWNFGLRLALGLDSLYYQTSASIQILTRVFDAFSCDADIKSNYYPFEGYKRFGFDFIYKNIAKEERQKQKKLLAKKKEAEEKKKEQELLAKQKTAEEKKKEQELLAKQKADEEKKK